MVSSGVGLASAVTSALFFGSFLLPLKSGRVRRAAPDPMVWQTYMSVAIFLSTGVVLLARGQPFVWTAYGLLSAALWVPSSILSIFAVRLLGLASAQAVWSASTILVSFSWGLFYFHDPVRSPPLAALALALILSGIYTVSLASRGGGESDGGELSSASPADDGAAAASGREAAPLLNPAAAGESPLAPASTAAAAQSGDMAGRARAAGLACALCIGLTNGSMLVPLKLAPDSVQGLDFVPSQAIGVFLLTPVAAFLFFLGRESPAVASLARRVGWPEDAEPAHGGEWSPPCLPFSLPPLLAREVMGPAFVSGVMWNVGNVSSILATTSPLGLTIGFPVTQCALLVGGMWGVCLFREITDPAKIRTFFAGAVIMLSGAALLAAKG